MISRHPEEFAYTPIDMTPLIDAARARDWNKIHNLLDSGYSLLWVDANTKETVLRMLAKESGNADIIIKLLEISQLENGKDSDAHKFIAIEATIGGLDNPGRCPIKEIAARCNAQYYSVYVPLAEMNSKHIGHLLLDEKRCPATADTIYHLARGKHLDEALSHLIRLRDKVVNNAKYSTIDARSEIKKGIKALLSAIALDKDADFDLAINKICTSLEISNIDAVLYAAIAEAAANGHEDWAFKALDQMIKMEHPELDDILGEAIISSAAHGRGDIIFRLCERARKAKVEKSKRFIDLLSSAAGAALVKEHSSLAKVIMKMAPEFHARPDDLKELISCPTTKVKRILRTIRDYAVFTDIALHSGVASNISSSSWVFALKIEYGLKDMSDEGFHTIVHHPAVLRELLDYKKSTNESAEQSTSKYEKIKEALVKHPGAKLSLKDIDYFISVMNKANQSISPNLSFFRLPHLMTTHHKPGTPTDEVEHYTNIKKEIMDVLRSYSQGIHFPKNKRVVAELHSALIEADNSLSIHQLISDKLKDGHQDLLEKCLAIFSKHNVSINTIHAPSSKH